MGRKNSNKCLAGKADCFAYNSRGLCRICRETNFKHDCPFYKTNKQRAEEHEASVQRLESLKRYDLINTYGESSSEQVSIWKEISYYGYSAQV